MLIVSGVCRLRHNTRRNVSQKGVKMNMCFLYLEQNGISGDFVSATCWIQGVYVYKELQSRVDKVAYFGIPKDMAIDGIYDDGDLCPTINQFDKEPDPDCRPMHKTFYLQVNLH